MKTDVNIGLWLAISHVWLFLKAVASAPPECTSLVSFLPLYHFMGSPSNPRFPDASNDANAIFFYKGYYHVMFQSNQGEKDWTTDFAHLVSTDLHHGPPRPDTRPDKPGQTRQPMSRTQVHVLIRLNFSSLFQTNDQHCMFGVDFQWSLVCPDQARVPTNMPANNVCPSAFTHPAQLFELVSDK